MQYSALARDDSPVLADWERNGFRRFDGSLFFEVARGSFALRFEAALGRIYGGRTSCTASVSGSADVPCDANPLFVNAEREPLDPTLSQWRRSLQLSFVVRPHGGAGGGAIADEQDTAALGRWRVGLAWAPVRATDFISDGHFVDGAGLEPGIEAAYVEALWRGLRLGAAARYSFGFGSSPLGETEHVLFIPALLGWAVRSPRTGAEFEFLAGVGPAAVALTYGLRSGHYWATGPGAEVGLSYIRPLAGRQRMDLVLGISVRAMRLRVRTGAEQNSNLEGARGFHGDISLHAGLRF
jgi:hypothetical protein